MDILINNMDTELKNLQKGHTYLLLRNHGSVFAAKILLITDKAYHIHWDSGNKTWELKDDLYIQYSLIEDISDFVASEKKDVEPVVLEAKTELVQCYICHGMGTIPEPNSTAGKKTCPACNGAKLVPKVISVAPKIE